MKLLQLILAGLIVVSLAACNTVNGFGKDVEKAGEVIQKGSGK
jgi:predicted small secreted protein